MTRLKLFAGIVALLVAGSAFGVNQSEDEMYNPDLPISMQHEDAWNEEVVLPHAQAGDAKAQVMLAMMYLQGSVKGTSEMSEDEIAQEMGRLLQAAADQGDAEGQYYLAYFYKKAGFGEFYPVNAAKWFHAAALQNHSDEQLELARIYADDQYPEYDLDKALMWLFVAKRSDNFEEKESYESKYRRFISQRFPCSKEPRPKRRQRFAINQIIRNAIDIANGAPSAMRAAPIKKP